MIERPLPELAATFVFGREAMVPAFFRPLLEKIQQHHWPNTQTLQAYLSHHITVDSDDHFPKALQLLAQVCEGGEPYQISFYRLLRSLYQKD